MKIVVAVDSFKGSLSSLDAGGAVRDGILRAFPDAEVEVCPLADGGEGTAEALTLGMGGSMRTAAVTGPLGEQREARYGVLRDGRTAVMEMAEAAAASSSASVVRPPTTAGPVCCRRWASVCWTRKAG